MKGGKYLLAALLGATLLPLVAFLGDNIDYLGGAVAAVPLIDLLPLLFIATRRSVQTTMVGDLIGQCGAVTAVFTAFYLLHYTAMATGAAVAVSLTVAFSVNAAAYWLIQRV